VTIANLVADLKRRYDDPEEPFTSVEVDELTGRMGISRQQFFEAMAAEIAQAFDAGDVAFQSADEAINDLWSIALCNDEHWPPLLEEVYRAFDAGEYAGGENVDPIHAYTRPAISEIARRLTNGS